ASASSSNSCGPLRTAANALPIWAQLLGRRSSAAQERKLVDRNGLAGSEVLPSASTCDGSNGPNNLSNIELPQEKLSQAAQYLKPDRLGTQHELHVCPLPHRNAVARASEGNLIFEIGLDGPRLPSLLGIEGGTAAAGGAKSERRQAVAGARRHTHDITRAKLLHRAGEAQTDPLEHGPHETDIVLPNNRAHEQRLGLHRVPDGAAASDELARHIVRRRDHQPALGRALHLEFASFDLFNGQLLLDMLDLALGQLRLDQVLGALALVARLERFKPRLKHFRPHVKVRVEELQHRALKA